MSDKNIDDRFVLIAALDVDFECFVFLLLVSGGVL